MGKLEAFEMWAYRRMLKISWKDKITNQVVLDRINKQKEVVLSVKMRKLQYLGHIKRENKYQLLQLIMQGKIEGRRSIGRRRMSWLRNLREGFACTSIQLFRAEQFRVKIAMMIANLRSGDGT
ncbi:unnamed protein product [Diabrotica balteata]|uniref:Uncharacterized protein n=1 Tax=Diabrotica balteata TaxID=107213 RepID=A0A9N9XG19_DIABA|nr:unnamed protein product [Diabrotica balteata]